MTEISVIVPCYNVGKYIKRCLDSLTKQTLTDIEIICVDDKSTDDTVNMIKNYKDSRITLILHKTNMGAGAARNNGLKVAKGEYVSFIDPDDYVDLDFYEKLYNATKKGSTDIVKACLQYTNTKEKTALNTLIKQDIANFNGEYTTAIYKRSFLNKYKIKFPTDIITGQDSVFLTNVVIKKPSISLIDNTTYWYYRHDGSLDSPILSHAKVLSRYNMVMQKTALIKDAKLNDAEFRQFMKTQVFAHVRNAIFYQYEQDDDRNMFFEYLHDIYKHYGMQQELQDVFGTKFISYLKSNNYIDKCNYYICSKKKRIYLFFVIPFLLVCFHNTISIVKLFDFLPILKISSNKSNCKKYYLFGFIPLFKQKG